MTEASTVDLSGRGFLTFRQWSGHGVRVFDEGFGDRIERPVLQRHNAYRSRHALETPSVKQRFAEFSTPIAIMTPAQTKALVENEQKLWWPLVRENEPK